MVESARVTALRQQLSAARTDTDRLPLLVELGSALAVTSLEESRRLLDDAIELGRRNDEYRVMSGAARVMAEAYVEIGDLKSALGYADILHEAAEGSRADEIRAVDRFIHGLIHEMRCEYAKAVERYEQSRGFWRACGSLKGESAVLNQLGNVSGMLGRVAEALAYYQDALRLADEVGDAEIRATLGFNVGWALQRLGRWEDAVESFYRVLAVEGSPVTTDLHANVYNSLGEVFLHRDKVAKAIDMFQRAMALAERSGGHTSNLREGCINLGQAHFLQGDLASASALYERALRLAKVADNPYDIAAVRWRRAELALAQGALDEALAQADASAALARERGIGSQEAEALRVRGLVLAARGDTESAAASFEAAVALYSDAEESYELATVNYHYGRFLLNLGKPEEATGLLKAAARTFRKLSIVTEAEEINRLLFQQDMRGDSDVALLQGISGLTPLGLEPTVLLDQALRLLREGLRFDAAAVVVDGRPVFIQGRPDLKRARSMSQEPTGAASPVALRWPVRCSDGRSGYLYMDRARPLETRHDPLVFDTLANLLATPITRAAELALRITEDRPELASLRFRGVVGRSPAMLQALSTVCRVADTDVPVLLRGESGTGKELVARALHDSGPRAAGPFAAVNCAALPDNLLEAEFFGVERGAATGVVARKGRFELADGGTIFLDEIGDMSPALQAKLLRVLQDRTVERVGGITSVNVDIRIVAATNQDLAALMARGTFRKDLYYRLNTVEVYLPPLRERPEDIPELVRHLVAASNEEFGRSIRGATDAALAQLERHPWPGNIRELQHVIERATILAVGDRIEVGDLPADLVSAAPPTGTLAKSDMRAAVKLAGDTAAAEVERSMILDCLARMNWNVKRAAEISGYSRAQFYRLMQKHRIARPEQPV